MGEREGEGEGEDRITEVGTRFLYLRSEEMLGAKLNN
jgi:hypothetical protein